MSRKKTRVPTGRFDPQLLRKDLGIKLRELRKQARLTQAQVVNKAGIGNEFVSRLEHGHGSPSLNTLGQLASAIGC